MLSISNYNSHRGIWSSLSEHNGRVCGFWMEGNNYHNTSSMYGVYPPSYLARMALLFPAYEGRKTLHLFSGSLKGIKGQETFDVRPEPIPGVFPTYCGDAQKLSAIVGAGVYDLIFADPPYDNNHVKYGTSTFSKKRVVHECSLAIKAGGFLVWLDTVIPMWAKRDGWELAGTIGYVQSTNHKVRVITILKKCRE